MKQVLVTGSNGFIGKYVMTELKRLGIKPVPYDRAMGQDVRSPNDLREAMGGSDGVIHLAGLLGTHELFEEYDEAISVNISGGINVARQALYYNIPMVSIEQPHIWENVYEASKGALRRILTSMAYDDDLSIGFVTAHNAYGPGQLHGPKHPQKIIPTFATRAWNNLTLPIWGDGQQKVNLVYAGDVAAELVNLLLAPSRSPNTEVQAGSTMLWTVNEVAEYVLDLVGEDFGQTYDFGSMVEYREMRRGEQDWVQYPEPDESYTSPMRYGMLDQTIRSYRPHRPL